MDSKILLIFSSEALFIMHKIYKKKKKLNINYLSKFNTPIYSNRSMRKRDNLNRSRKLSYEVSLGLFVTVVV